MSSFELKLAMNDGIPVISVQGYFSGEAGAEAITKVGELLAQGHYKIIMDFSPCKLMNSPGVAQMTFVAMAVVDEHKGKLILTGLDDLKSSVLEMVGVFPMAEKAASVAEAMKKIKG